MVLPSADILLHICSSTHEEKTSKFDADIPAGSFVQATEFKKANKDELRNLFKYLEFCLQQVVKDNELGALQQVSSLHLFLPAATSEGQGVGYIAAGKQLVHICARTLPHLSSRRQRVHSVCNQHLGLVRMLSIGQL